MAHTVDVAGIAISNERPLVLLAGLNVLESAALALEVAGSLAATCSTLGLPYVFKASFDKANRSSATSYRGPGLEEGLKILAEVKARHGVPIVTDIHEPAQAAPVAEVADILQIPAFLCRQTDLVRAACETGRPVHVKKGQFLAPEDVGNIVAKCRSYGCEDVLLGERGSSFGYRNLVVDFLGFPILKATGCPLVFDVTHSLQRPGGLGHATAGRRGFLRSLALSGVAQGIAALFLELHPAPDEAKCDGPCAWPLALAQPLLEQVCAVDRLVKGLPPLLDS